MTPRYLIKLATTQKQQPIPYRYVSPLAQMIAMQFGVRPDQLTNPDLGPALKQMYRSIVGGNRGYIGRIDDYANSRAIPSRDDNGAYALNTLYAQGQGYPGATDVFAEAHKITGKNNMSGAGQNFNSLSKFKDIGSTNFMGGGRNGGGSPVQS